MGNKQAVEKEIYGQLANYRKLNAVKKEIENSEFWGVTRRLAAIDAAVEVFNSKGQTPGGYAYASGGFERMNANGNKMKKKVSDYKTWRNAQIDMRVSVSEEMQKISTKVWELQNNYNAKKDDGDMIGIQIAQYGWNW